MRQPIAWHRGIHRLDGGLIHHNRRAGAEAGGVGFCTGSDVPPDCRTNGSSPIPWRQELIVTQPLSLDPLGWSVVPRGIAMLDTMSSEA